jgi:4-amino-4-deoxy-L-arabinose transferase-like glycosyltransferase
MPIQHRPPAPKLPAALEASAERRKQRLYYLLAFFLLFATPLFAIHLPLLGLPFFWDEHGQFVPSALDLLRSGRWIPHSTVPNVHPPGIAAYLALWYKLFGFSIKLTRLAMLLLAGLGLTATFLLAIELSQGTKGAPAFLPPLFLLASPLFFTQSMMAQLDMPAMVFTVLALLLFIKRGHAMAAAACVVLVLVKETGIVVPFVFSVVLALRRKWRHAAFYIAPAVALLAWLIVLHRSTGCWLGNPGFAHYNVEYSMQPVHIVLSFLRRVYYLFFAEFRWIGTVAIVYAVWQHRTFRSPHWRVAIAMSALTVVLVSVLGGAELERYLLPVLPIFYIAAAVALTYIPRRISAAATAALLAGLAANLFWNPPYPFPYENNLAMVDFVRLQQFAAVFAERNLPNLTIATAWPYSGALRNPDYGFVDRKLKVIETNNFHLSSIRAIPPASYDVLITYTRTWAPENGLVALPFVRRLLARFYQWQPEITPQQCAALGLAEMVSWSTRGQEIAIYVRPALRRP